LTAPIFSNHLNFETESDMSEKHDIESLDLQTIYECDLSFLVASRFVPKLPKFEKIGAVKTFLTSLWMTAICDK